MLLFLVIQGQKVNSKVKNKKKYDFYQTQKARSVIHLFDVIFSETNNARNISTTWNIDF